LRFPAPNILGPLLAISLVSACGLKVSFPENTVSFFSKVIIGAFIGLRFDQNCTKLLRDLTWPAIIVSLWMLGSSVGCGMLLYHFTNLPSTTALVGSTAGGITEMALLAMSLEADVASITILQVFRLAGSMFIMPLLAARHASKRSGIILNNGTLPCETDDLNIWRYLVFVSLAFIGGLMGTLSRIPAGTLLGSMLSVGLFRALGMPMWSPPKIFQSIAQIGVGITIGLYITKDTLQQLYSMLGPVLLLTTGMIVCGIILSYVLKRITNWDWATCLLSASPAGLTQMGAIADEMGANPIIVSLMHTVRLASILLVIPLLVTILLD